MKGENDSNYKDGCQSQQTNTNTLINEIEEEEDEKFYYSTTSYMFEMDHNNGGLVRLDGTRSEGDMDQASLFSFDFNNKGGDIHDIVYVAVWNKNISQEESSMNALFWTLKHGVINPNSAIVFLIHIFPQTKYIPTLLGMIPISQVNEEQKEKFMAQERSKRRLFLKKFVDICTAFKVKVDTILIESDMEGKAILDLIPICNIRKLILGTSKANIKKMMSRRGNGTAYQILQNAPEFCEVKIICEGKEIVELQMFESLSLRSDSIGSPKSSDSQSRNLAQESQNESNRCKGCFRAKVMP
ncbi:PREDICTED: U-box domain-containing protein 36-like [Nicotiana attenuata]|uniref:U-box domain-containing protein 33 n=1 Tax=Nicotiana attenuata TaxID=49451 RepID=A0A314KJL1_NICAT|nr:PREDICTED: U-box domain-containing protein 36-like [Nicotiana attenuata]OIT28964.1 u-box domain-containing protein 33 [Nicotiana attenuata]